MTLQKFLFKLEKVVFHLLEKPAFCRWFKMAGISLMVLGVTGLSVFAGEVLKDIYLRGGFRFEAYWGFYRLGLAWLIPMLLWIYVEKLRRDYDECEKLREELFHLYKQCKSLAEFYRRALPYGTHFPAVPFDKEFEGYGRLGFDPEKWNHGFEALFDRVFSRWDFTEAEKEVGFRLVAGFSQAQIAEMRNTSLKTVKNQTTVIYEKAQVANRHELSSKIIQMLLPSFDKSQGQEGARLS